MEDSKELTDREPKTYNFSSDITMGSNVSAKSEWKPPAVEISARNIYQAMLKDREENNQAVKQARRLAIIGILVAIVAIVVAIVVPVLLRLLPAS